MAQRICMICLLLNTEVLISKLIATFLNENYIYTFLYNYLQEIVTSKNTQRKKWIPSTSDPCYPPIFSCIILEKVCVYKHTICIYIQVISN